MSGPEVRNTLPLAEYLGHAGRLEAVSDWIEVNQSRIDDFAKATGDHQFIHVDPVRAKAETPFGGAIAHGFLSLSLLSVMAYQALPVIAEAAHGLNYGFDKIRFLAPVRAGSRIRGHFRLLECSERRPGEILSRHAVTVEIEGSEKPALVAEWLNMVILRQIGHHAGTSANKARRRSAP